MRSFATDKKTYYFIELDKHFLYNLFFRLLLVAKLKYNKFAYIVISNFRKKNLAKRLDIVFFKI